MQSFGSTSSRVQGAVCAAVLLVAAAVCHPVAEMGIYDDWSYVRTAQLLAQTGHIHYNGWATAMLGWQLFPAALAMRLFGSSFTVARLTTVLVAAFTVFLMQRSFARGGLRLMNATLATLTVVLSPLFLPLATTYMSDIYGLLPIVACLYCCLRAVQGRAAAAPLWLAAASLVDVVGGTARQISWLGVLVMVPCAAWCLRRNSRVVVTAAACWVLSAAAIFACMRWFKHQPYAVPEIFPSAKFNGAALAALSVNFVRLGLECGLLLLPVLVAFLPLTARNRKTAGALVAAVVGLAVVALGAHHFVHNLGQFLVPTLTDGGNFVSVEGVLSAWPESGMRPILLPDLLRLGLTLLVLAGGSATLLAAVQRNNQADDTSVAQGELPWRVLLWLTVPFTGAYLLLLAPRSAFFHPYDRYCLPLVTVAALLSTRLYQERAEATLPAISVALLSTVAVYSVCTTHDMFAMYRGTARSTAEVLASGVPATALDGGWEFDGWTQITRDIFVHDPRLRLKEPAGTGALSEHRPCTFELHYLFPVVEPHYTLAFAPDLCGGATDLRPVRFRTWLPWRLQTIYVVKNEPVMR